MAKIVLEKSCKTVKLVKVVVGLRTVAPEENCPLTLKLTLTQTLAGGNCLNTVVVTSKCWQSW